MFGKKQEIIVLSIGGSLLVPNGGVDTQFVKKLDNFIRSQVKEGRRFLLVVGGGKTARNYRDAGKEVVGEITDDDLDWIGIHATRLNAHLLRTIFKDIAHPRIIENYDHPLINWTEPIAIGAGWKPGWSTDYDAVILAHDHHASSIINLTNIDWVYDKDPAQFPDAKKIKKTTWNDFETIVGTEWKPGINAPFDPVASQLAKKHRLTVIIANGNNFDNIEKILKGEEFKGTIISPQEIDSTFYDQEYFEGKKKNTLLPRQEFLIETYDNLLNWYRALWIKLFLNPKNCLDVGAGRGLLVLHLRRLGIEAYGIEVSDYALENALKEVKPYLIEGNISKIPYETDSFDLVCSFNVMEHIDRTKLKSAIEESVRVSRKWIMHRIYTAEKKSVHRMKGFDYSHISVMSQRFWESLFKSLENVNIKNNFFNLPSFFDTLYILRKK